MTNLNSVAEQFGDLSKSSVDAAMKFASVGVGSTERFFGLTVDATNAGFDVSAKNAKAVVTVKDVQELNSLQTKAAETGLEFLMGYSKNFYEIASSAQAQYSSLVEERVSLFQKSMLDTLDTVSKSAPAGSDVFVNALKTGLTASAAASDSFTNAAKQASSYANSAFNTATATAEKAVKPAAAKRK